MVSPQNSDCVLKIDWSTQCIETFGSVNKDGWKWCGGVFANEKICCVPRCDASVLIIDPRPRATTCVACPTAGNLLWAGYLRNWRDQRPRLLFCRSRSRTTRLLYRPSRSRTTRLLKRPSRSRTTRKAPHAVRIKVQRNRLIDGGCRVDVRSSKCEDAILYDSITPDNSASCGCLTLDQEKSISFVEYSLPSKRHRR